MKIITISQLNSYIKDRLESDHILSNVWVKGEISNFKHHSSGHMYFTLKDKTSQLKCVMFRSRAQNLQFMPSNGMAVISRGYVTVFERDGQYQLYVEEIQPDGIGALYTAFLQLKERLQAEGLFESEIKKPIPRFPQRVGVVTSPTGAAVRDIITVIQRRFPQTHILIIPVKVQGEEAPAEIEAGIRLANNYNKLDVLIIGRGGGSIEELWAFNTERVARSIFDSRIPVVSAVGHETDFTIADFVADRRAPTPSAAAEMVVPDIRELQKHIDSQLQHLVNGTKSKVVTLQERLARLTQSNVLRRPKDEIYKKMMELDYLTRGMRQNIRILLNTMKSSLGMSITSLDNLSPLATLSRGYSIATDSQGKVINQAGCLKPGDYIEVIMKNGSVECNVSRVKEGKDG